MQPPFHLSLNIISILISEILPSPPPTFLRHGTHNTNIPLPRSITVFFPPLSGTGSLITPSTRTYRHFCSAITCQPAQLTPVNRRGRNARTEQNRNSLTSNPPNTRAETRKTRLSRWEGGPFGSPVGKGWEKEKKKRGWKKAGRLGDATKSRDFAGDVSE